LSDDSAAIGIIGIPNESDIPELEKAFGKPIKRIEKKDKVILLIGKGLLKKRITIPKENQE